MPNRIIMGLTPVRSYGFERRYYRYVFVIVTWPLILRFREMENGAYYGRISTIHPYMDLPGKDGRRDFGENPEEQKAGAVVNLCPVPASHQDDADPSLVYLEGTFLDYRQAVDEDKRMRGMEGNTLTLRFCSRDDPFKPSTHFDMRLHDLRDFLDLEDLAEQGYAFNVNVPAIRALPDDFFRTNGKPALRTTHRGAETGRVAMHVA